MNSGRVVRTAVLCSTLLCFSASIAWASCDDKDRPKTPTNLKVAMGNPPLANVKTTYRLVLAWTQNQTRTGSTCYDIHVRDKKGNDIPGMGVTGGACQPSTAGGQGQFAWHDPPYSKEYKISMRARTKSGTEGCISETESETITVARQ
jgi:hypothetical protein